MVSVLLHGWKIWIMRNVGDVRSLELFHHQCLRSVAWIGWSDHASTVEARNLVFGAGSENTLYVWVWGLIDYVGWVTCFIWWTLIYHTVTYFAFLPWSGRNHVEVGRWRSHVDWELRSVRHLMSSWLGLKRLINCLAGYRGMWQRPANSGDQNEANHVHLYS